MPSDELDSRLSRISTQWTLVLRAHEGGDADLSQLARNELMQRYCGAAYRYLYAALGDPDVADELFQEFALRFARGDFRRADPGRGQFRKYVKSVLINMVLAYKKKGRRGWQTLDQLNWEPAANDDRASEADQQFAVGWREELLARAWSALEQHQATSGKPYFDVLRLKSENPQLSSAELGVLLVGTPVVGRTPRPSEPSRSSTESVVPPDKLRTDEASVPHRHFHVRTDEASVPHPKPLSDTGVRKLLQRAREKFAVLLLNEVRRTLEGPSRARLEEELIDLGLYSYCRSAL